MLLNYLKMLNRKKCHVFGFALMIFLAAGGVLKGQSQSLFSDTLDNGWEDWGWATLNYANSAPVHAGSKSISVTIAAAWQAIYWHHASFDTTGYTNLTFWINGGATGGQKLQVQALLNGAAQTAVALNNAPTNSWVQISVPLAALGVANQANVDGFWIMDRIGAAQPTFFLDDVVLAGSVAPLTNGPVSIVVNGNLDTHPISDLIYGLAFATSNQLKDLNAPLNRSGGNPESRYNWKINSHNRGADWYFLTIGDSSSTQGGAADEHVANSKAAGAETMLTVPMLGWVAKSRTKSWSYSMAKYGSQTDQDPTTPDAGNGVRSSDGGNILTNNPADASVSTDSIYQQDWIKYLTNRWGSSAKGGVRFYLMDNEPSIWHSSHRDVHHNGATMAEVRDKFFDYAGKVKAVDPTALVCGPEEWGWSGYFWSGYDQQHGVNATPSDRGTNGGWDYLPWFLDQARQRATNTNQRLLDYFTVHYYPQGGEYGMNVSQAMQLRRNRSTRSLWDTNYTDETWINDRVQLIPRIRGWANNYYPGTKAGITEYNWGAEDHINGATSQADVLGIFGRERLDLATRWTTPPTGSPAYQAIKMFRNYDGQKSRFGDLSVSATGPNPDYIAAFAARRTVDGTLTLMLINKQLTNTASTTVLVTNYPHSGIASVWQLTSQNVITQLNPLAFSGNLLTNSLPPQSITLLVLPPAQPRLRSGSLTNGMPGLWLDGLARQQYVLEISGDATQWLPLQTNTLSSNSWFYPFPFNRAKAFYRARWSP
jgi:hypothetical protein